MHSISEHEQRREYPREVTRDCDGDVQARTTSHSMKALGASPPSYISTMASRDLFTSLSQEEVSVLPSNGPPVIFTIGGDEVDVDVDIARTPRLKVSSANDIPSTARLEGAQVKAKSNQFVTSSQYGERLLDSNSELDVD